MKPAPDAYLQKNPPPKKKPKPIFFENSFTEMHAQLLHEFRHPQETPVQEVIETSQPAQSEEIKLPPEEERNSLKPPVEAQQKAPSRERSPNQKTGGEAEITTQASSKKSSIEKTSLKALIGEKVTFNKLHHKSFVAQINGFLEVLKTISNSDKHYGKGLKGLGVGSSSIFSQEEGLFDYSLHENSQIASADLGVKERALFVKRFGEQLVKKEKIILPEWRVIRNTINAVGNISLECSNSIEKVAQTSF